MNGGALPPNAVEGGIDGETLYIGRATHEGALIPGKVRPVSCFSLFLNSKLNNFDRSFQAMVFVISHGAELKSPNPSMTYFVMQLVFGLLAQVVIFPDKLCRVDPVKMESPCSLDGLIMKARLPLGRFNSRITVHTLPTEVKKSLTRIMRFSSRNKRCQ